MKQDMKKCKYCGKVKSLSDFHVFRNGHQPRCKKCISEYSKKRYIAKRQEILDKNSLYRKTEKGKTRMNLSVKSWAKKNPLVHKAHISVMNALRYGKLFRNPCQECGTSEYINAHHEDYNKPLEVIWLCRKHHIELHNKYRENEIQQEKDSR